MLRMASAWTSESLKVFDQHRLRLVLAADDLDDLVEVEIGDEKAAEHFQPMLDLGEPMARAPQQHVAAMREPFGQRFGEPDHLGDAAADQHVHVQRNPAFQFAELEQAFHHQRRIDAARARLEHQPDVLGGFVAHVGDQRQLLFVDQLGDLLDEPHLLHLPGNFGDHDQTGAAAGVLGVPARPQAERAAPGGVGLGDRLGRIDDDAAGREIRARARISTACGCARWAARSDKARRRTARRRCAAGSRSPCRPRCPARRWRAGSETPPAAPPAPATRRRSWGGNRRRPRRCRRAGAARLRSAAPRCSGRRRRYRRRYCRNCPGRRPADSARRNPARGAPSRRRSPGRHADGN